MNTILVTGAAGFIGFHISKRSFMRGDCVVGIDNPNNYGDVNLKLARLKQLVGFKPNTPIETGMKHFVEWENSLLWQIISYLNRES